MAEAKRSKMENWSLCEEIICHILKEVPVKSLMRFKCVSKDWLRLIENPYFVDCHRQRSHHRPGGIQILEFCLKLVPQDPRTESPDYKISRSCFLFDPEKEDSRPILIQMPFLEENCKHGSFSYADGLICSGNRIWNPSTREVLKLPPVERGLNVDLLPENTYLLGFDTFNKKYKVVCIMRRKEVVVNVLTIGGETNSWKQIHFFPKEFRDGFEIITSRIIDGDIEILESKSFGGFIYCLVSCGGIKEGVMGILTFDVQHEKIGFIGFPDGLVIKPKKRYNVVHPDTNLVEIGGCLAIYKTTEEELWVLNHEAIRGRTERGCSDLFSCVKLSFDDYIDGPVTPCGTIHTNEILFVGYGGEYAYKNKISVLGYDEDDILFVCYGEDCVFNLDSIRNWREDTPRNNRKYFFYDLKSKKIRFLPKLMKNVYKHMAEYMVIKHVESAVCLKPRKLEE